MVKKTKEEMKAIADAQSENLNAGKPATAPATKAKKPAPKKPAAKKPAKPKSTSTRKAKAKPLTAAQKAKKEADELKAKENEISALFGKLSGMVEELATHQTAISEMVGEQSGRITTMTKNEDWHKTAFGDIRKIAKMSKTKRRDYLATLIPLLDAMWIHRWRDESKDLLDDLGDETKRAAEAQISEDDFDRERAEDGKVVPISNAKKGGTSGSVADEPVLSDDDEVGQK